VASPSSRAGRAICFVVDASGSLSSRYRLEAVRHAARQLLTQTSQDRHYVSLVVAQGGKARCEVPLTRDTEKVDQAIEGVRPGGKTPMAHAYVMASHELQRARDRGLAPTLIVLTDGRTNVSLTPGGDPIDDIMVATRQLAEKELEGLVIDMRSDPGHQGLARVMAERLGATYLRWDNTEEHPASHLGDSILRWLERDR
jgi:magnesium chelatase subunit D